MYRVTDLFDLSHSLAGEYLFGFEFPWQALDGIGAFIESLFPSLSGSEYRCVKEGVYVHVTAEVAPTACLNGPCIVGARAQIRHCAFIRGNALVGEDCVVGNSVELKNVILFDGVQVPHFNYVGDSVLGYKAHMGAGAITSNVKSDKSLVVIRGNDLKISTSRKKVGAFLGDHVEVGCNCVLNPGTVVGRNTRVYPLLSLRGVYPENSIVKTADKATPQNK